jgi:hypothetical protein
LAVLVALTPLVPAAMEGLAVMRPAAVVARVDILAMAGLVVRVRNLGLMGLEAEAAEEVEVILAIIKMNLSNISKQVEAGPEAMLVCLALA